MEDGDEPAKQIEFIGQSLDEVRDFPKNVMQDAGQNLRLVQKGHEPADWVAMRGVGKGVREIRLWDDSGTYRVIYVATLGNTVYVLCAFKKTSEKTEKRHLDLIKNRYKKIGGQ